MQRHVVLALKEVKTRKGADRIECVIAQPTANFCPYLSSVKERAHIITSGTRVQRTDNKTCRSIPDRIEGDLCAAKHKFIIAQV